MSTLSREQLIEALRDASRANVAAPAYELLNRVATILESPKADLPDARGLAHSLVGEWSLRHWSDGRSFPEELLGKPADDLVDRIAANAAAERGQWVEVCRKLAASAASFGKIAIEDGVAFYAGCRAQAERIGYAIERRAVLDGVPAARDEIARMKSEAAPSLAALSLTPKPETRKVRGELMGFRGFAPREPFDPRIGGLIHGSPSGDSTDRSRPGGGS